MSNSGPPDSFEHRYDACVEAFYGASVGKVSWSVACQRLADLVGVWTIQITGIGKRAMSTRFSWDGGSVPAQVWLDYFTRYHAINPRIPPSVGLEVGEWQHDHELFPAEIYEESPFFREFLIPYGAKYCSATKLIDDEDMVVILAAHLKRDRPPLTEAQVGLLDRVRCHLVQAIEGYRSLQRGLSDSLIARTMLDALPQPVMLVDETLYLHHFNHAAADMLEASGAVFERGGMLRFKERQDSDRTVLAIRELGLTGAVASDERQHQVVFRLGEQAGHAELLVIAIGVHPEETMAMFGGAPRAILLFHRLDGEVRLDPLIISHAFGLTPAEAQVAATLVAGQTIAEVAKSRGVSLETVRSQVRSICAKVGVSRQADLTRVLTQLPQVNLELSPRTFLR